jgi:8-oxo-dGTP pyrophosphatase MutT (NUDIX family)
MIDAGIVAAIRLRLTSALAPPRDRLRPLRVDGHAAGWLDARRAARLAAFHDVFRVDGDALVFAPGLADEAARTQALEGVARALEAEGALTAWRGEAYAVAPAHEAPPRFLLERAAARYFGIRTYAAHINGIVEAADGARMWLARRSATKSVDPGLLDNLVGGGVAAGQTVAGTVIKEAWEEAGIGAALAARAVPAGTVQLCRMQPDGLQRETIFVHDLSLPADFRPAPQDGEAVDHRLVSAEEAASLIANAAGDDVVTADASLVVLDWLLRHGAIARDSPDYSALDALRRPDCGLAD